MFIQAPLNPKAELYIEQYLNFGADEFYLGYANELRLSSQVLSRRQGPYSNFPSIESTKQIIYKIKKNNKKVYITLNLRFYTENYFYFILRDIKYFVDLGVDGFIISDINLLFKLKENFPRIFLIASTCAVVTNSNAVKFFKNIGINKFILPRHLTIGEIKNIINKNKKTPFEIFIKNDKCPNIDGFCSYFHQKIKNESYELACRKIKISKGPITNKENFNSHSCGVCALFELKNLPKISLKISGRDRQPESIIKDIIFIKETTSFLQKTKLASVYYTFCKEKYKQIYGYSCKNDCYYGIN